MIKLFYSLILLAISVSPVWAMEYINGEPQGGGASIGSYEDVVGLWTDCGSLFMKGDGTCSAGSIVEVDPLFAAWDKSTGISITTSQISDIATYLGYADIVGLWGDGTGFLKTDGTVDTSLYQQILTEGAFVDGDKTKLDGIAAGAEVNVNADWNAVAGDAVIQNKPTIPSASTDLSDTADLLRTTNIGVSVEPAGAAAAIIASSVTESDTTHCPDGASLFTALAGKQAADADLTYLAGFTPTANVKSVLNAADYAAIRALLDLEAGTDFYSISAADLAFEPIGVSVADLTGTDVTADELNAVVDGDTAASDVTISNTDQIPVNDGGTMLQVAFSKIEAWIIAEIDTILDNVSLSPSGGAWDLSNVDVSLSKDMVLAVTGTINGLTNSFTITTAEGVHDGDNNAATLSDSGESFPTDNYIGMTLYNTTDGSSCEVTDNNGTTMTCTLTGGTDNDWDTNDTWAVSPGPQQSGTVWYINAATTILHPATAYYSACYYSDGANTIKVDPQSDSMTIYLNGAALAGAGYELDSAGAAGDFICIQNRSATQSNTLGRSGTWTDGGAS